MWKFSDTPHSMETWCRLAASYIRFPLDRPTVERELMEHLQDKVDDFVEHGMPQEEAVRRAVQEMGEPRGTGLLLRQIHKPYLGWVWKGTVWVVRVLLVIAVVWLLTAAFYLDIEVASDDMRFTGYNPFEDTHYENESGSSDRIFYSEPLVSDSSDDYRFTVQKVAYWEGAHLNAFGSWEESNRFTLLLEVTNFKPWAGRTDVPCRLYAVDSSGNYYYSSAEYLGHDGPSLHGNWYRTGAFTYTWHLWANNYVSQDAEWIELRYDRDGRDLCLRIDLTGGEGS